MKTDVRVFAWIFLSLALSSGSAMAQQGEYRLGEVIGLRYFTITAGDAGAYEKLAKDHIYPFYDRTVPGVDWVLMKGERGARSGQYAFFFNAATLDKRDFYWPQEEGPWPEWVTVANRWDAEVADRVGEYEFTQEFVGDFVLIGAETVPDTPRVELMGIHHIVVKAGREEAFERFLTEKWNPNARVPGLWILGFKADRGQRAGSYIIVYAFDPASVREVFYSDGELSEDGRSALEPISALREEMASYLDPSTEWTDFVIVR